MKKINKNDLSLNKETVSFLSGNETNSAGKNDAAATLGLGCDTATFASVCLCESARCDHSIGCTASAGPICCGPITNECMKVTEEADCRNTKLCGQSTPCLITENCKETDNVCVQSDVCEITVHVCLNTVQENCVETDRCITKNICRNQ